MKLQKRNKKRSNNYGYEFDLAFAEYIKSTLKYQGVKLGNQIASKNGQSTIEVDIIGFRADIRSKRLEKRSLIYGIIGIALIVFAIFLGYDNNFTNRLCRPFLICGIIIATGGICYIMLNEIFNKENIWVECRNIESKIDIEQANLMLTKIREYKESEDTKYKFKEFVFVSANGFNDNALELLIDNKVNCYIKKEGKFVRIAR